VCFFGLEMETTASRLVTPREVQIFRWLARGKTQPEIASIEGVSPHTVRTHVRRVMEKTGSATCTSAVVALIKIGALQLD